MSASRVTEVELNIIKNALENPPSKADGVAMVTVLLPAIALIIKTGLQFTAWDLVLLALAVGGIVLSIRKYVKASTASQPLHDQAKGYVNNLISMTQAPAEASSWTEKK